MAEPSVDGCEMVRELERRCVPDVTESRRRLLGRSARPTPRRSVHRRGAGARWWGTAVLLPVVLAASCSQSSDDAASTANTSASTTTTAVTTAPTTAAPTPPPSSLGPAPPTGLGPGQGSPQVLALEQRLGALRYDPGPVDGRFDDATAAAVVAFQKVSGLPRTGRGTQDVLDALASAQPPPPLVPGGGAARIEIDLPRQVLFVYQADAVSKILPVSSASGKRFCSEGECGTAVTPAGAYRVGGRIPGWRKSPLGRLFNPVYIDFKNGIAIHGFAQVPPQPASHGCIRIPMHAAGWFFQQVPDGTPVFVLDGTRPPAALGPPPAVPGETPASVKKP